MAAAEQPAPPATSTGGQELCAPEPQHLHAEEALRASQQQLQAQYKGFPLPTYTWQHIDGDFVLIDHNDAAETMTQGRIGELTGRSAYDLYGEDDPEILEDMRRCFRGQATVRRQHHYRVRSTGDEREVATTYVFVPPDLVMAHVEDITERLAGEQALRESEARFRLLAENAQDMIFRVTAEHGFEYVSPAVTAMAGYEPADYYADREFPLKIVHPEDRARLQQMIDERETGPVELRWIAKDGRVIWTEQTNTPVYDEAGALVALEGIVRDVTNRKRAEDEIRLLLTLTQAVEEADDFDAALTTVLAKVSQAAGWDYAEAWLPDQERRVLELSPAGYAGSLDFAEFRRASRQLVLARNSCLAGRVWATKKPVWLDGTRGARDGMVRRASLAERAGFKAALAVPILAEGEVVAVLAFFACRVLPEDKRTMDFISGTAAQLGSVVLRKRAEEELRGAREALEERVERRLERGAAYGLTFRETTVLHLVAQGKSDKEIAVELGISPLTAHKHLSNILSKMGAASRTEAGVRAVREGLLG